MSHRKGHLIWASDLNREVHGEVLGIVSREWIVPGDYHNDSAMSAHGSCCGQAHTEDASTLSGLLAQACLQAVQEAPSGRPRARPTGPRSTI